MNQLQLTMSEILQNDYPTEAYSKEDSKLFSKYVKQDNFAKVVEMLEKDKYLIHQYDFLGQTALHLCAKRGLYKILSYLIFKRGNF